MDVSNLYQRLLRLYPASFREQYQHAIERQFRDEYRDTSTRRERVHLWLKAFRDLMTSVPAEVARELWQDMRYAIRLHQKRPLPAVLAVIALALSIGACTGVFSVLNALLLRTLPFRSPEELVELRSSPFTGGVGRAGFYSWRDKSAYLQDAAGFSVSDMNLSMKNGALRVRVAETSANFTALLGMTPASGRTFAIDEDQHGHTNAAVISHALWHQVFGGDPSTPGTSIELNGVPLTVIGIAPPGFDYPGKTNVWTPTLFDFERMPKRGAIFFQTIGRLKPGVRIEQARRLFESEVQRSAPELLRAEGSNRPRLVGIREELSGPVGKAGWVLAAMVLFVLLTACANIAHLLLSRIAERRHELAMRTALGASRARLVQQLTTEAIALSAAGAALGLVLASWVAQLATSVAPPVLTAQRYTILDWRVGGFAAVLALLTGSILGLFPSLVVERILPAEQLIRNQPGSHESRTARLRFTLMAFQACMTIVLLAASVAMGRSFLHMLGTDLGFRPENAVTMTVSIQGTKHRTAAAERRYYTEVLERIRTVPGVEAAGAVGHLPLANNVYMANDFKLDSGEIIGTVVTNAASEGYFHAMGTRFVAGGDFGAARGGRTERAVIVTEAFARNTAFGNHVVGRKIIAPWSETPYLITGVVESSRFGGPAHPGVAMIYWLVEEEPPPHLTFVARVKGAAETYLARCRDAVKSVDAGVPIHDVRTLEQRRTDILSRPRFFTTATLFLAGLAVLLAAVGTFGMTAQNIAQQSRDIGIRMALGGSHSRLQTMILRASLAPTIFGGALGIGLALAGGRYLAHLVDNVQTIGLFSCAAAAGVLVLCALLAAWRASMRLLRIDPSEVLRAS
jgi:putative ABC transport system permease protein